MAARELTLRHLALFAVWLLGFALGASAVGRVAGTPLDPAIAARLRHLASHPGEYDTLFFGSSLTHRSVDPAVFDAEMAALGRPTRSFNLAFPGMRPHETDALLRRVLESRPRGLRHVVIELADWTPEIPGAGRFTARAIAWHDSFEVLSVLRSLWRWQAPLPEKLALARTHLLHWAAGMTGVGRAADALRPGGPATEQPPEQIEREIAGRGFRGFEPEEYREGPTALHRRKFLASLDAYRRAVAGLHEANAARTSLARFNVEAVEAQVDAVRAAGALPVFLIPPLAEPTPELHELGRAGIVPTLLSFSDPVAYPALFEPERRFDLRHLDSEGSRLFTRLLARQFAAQLGDD